VVKELVDLKVNILVVPVPSAIRAAMQATKTIPIVIVSGQDPVAEKWIDSLAHPGGNVTGVSTLSRELSGKRLELLKEIVPRLSRVAILTDADSRSWKVDFNEYETAAREMKLQIQALDVRGPSPDLERSFQVAVKARAQALVTITNANLFLLQKRIAELAIKKRLPSAYQGSSWVEAGGLMSYSTNDVDAYRRAARYIDKIFKGSKPSDLPVEQPMKFEFVINLKTAKQIGLEIPQWTLMKADRVIK
jgi:putative ABC transport system substrate-binding protein